MKPEKAAKIILQITSGTTMSWSKLVTDLPIKRDREGEGVRRKVPMYTAVTQTKSIFYVISDSKATITFLQATNSKFTKVIYPTFGERKTTTES